MTRLNFSKPKFLFLINPPVANAPGGFCYNLIGEKERKFYSIFFKKSWESKGQSPVVVFRRKRNPISSRPARTITKKEAVRRPPADVRALIFAKNQSLELPNSRKTKHCASKLKLLYRSCKTVSGFCLLAHFVVDIKLGNSILPFCVQNGSAVNRGQSADCLFFVYVRAGREGVGFRFLRKTTQGRRP